MAAPVHVPIAPRVPFLLLVPTMPVVPFGHRRFRGVVHVEIHRFRPTVAAMMGATRHRPLVVPVTCPLWTYMECDIPPAPISQHSGLACRTIRPRSTRSVLPFSHPLDPDGKSSGPERPPANRSICGPGEVSYFADRTPPRWGRSGPIVPSRKGGAHPGTHDAMSLTHRATIMAVMDRDAMRYSDVLTTLSRPHPSPTARRACRVRASVEYPIEALPCARAPAADRGSAGAHPRQGAPLLLAQDCGLDGGSSPARVLLSAWTCLPAISDSAQTPAPCRELASAAPASASAAARRQRILATGLINGRFPLPAP